MKKYLAMFLTLMMMFSFVSCGDTQESSSEPLSSISESATEEPTTEEPTEPATEEPTTEPETEPPTEEEITLDSEWECDYLTIAKSSEWDEQITEENGEISVFWYNCKISLFLRDSILGKMSENDLVKNYSDLQYDDHKILDTFEKNGQAYLIMGTESTGSRDLMFSTDEVDGTIYYSVEDEEIVMDMIDSIEFKGNTATAETTEEEVTTTETTEPPTEKPTSPPVKQTEPPTNPPIIVQEDSQTVYYTETGSKYHYDSKCGRGDYFPCTLDEALEMGLEPCKKCT